MLDEARTHIRREIYSTGIHWGFEYKVMVIVMGLGNLGGANISADVLKIMEDGPISSGEWYREGNFPTVIFNGHLKGYIAYRYGPENLANIARRIIATF